MVPGGGFARHQVRPMGGAPLSGAEGLIEVEVGGDRLRIGGVEGGRLVEVEEEIGIIGRLFGGRERAGVSGGAEAGSPKWRRMPVTVKGSVRKARILISAPQSGQRSGRTS
jgi:hypothetical protein